MEAKSATFACQKCGMPYDWSPEIVGKVAKCPCGAVLKIPSAAPGTEEFKKEIAYKDPNPGCLLTPPSINDGEGAEDVIVPMYAPVASPDGRKRAPMEVPDEELDAKTEAELQELAQFGDNDQVHKPNPYLDVKLPLILLGIGLMLIFGQASFLASRHVDLSLTSALFNVTASLLVNIVFMSIGMLAAGKFTGINFGNIPSAILKIAAIYVAPTTLSGLLVAALGGDMPYQCLGWGVSVVLYWALLKYLFRLDTSQTLACVLCIGLIKLVTQMFIMGSMLSTH